MFNIPLNSYSNRVAAKFVPKNLSAEQKQLRHEVAPSIGYWNAYRMDQISSVITDDESWVLWKSVDLSDLVCVPSLQTYMSIFTNAREKPNNYLRPNTEAGQFSTIIISFTGLLLLVEKGMANIEKPILLVHGGAGMVPDSRVQAKLDGVRQAARRGYQVMQETDSVLDGIVAAVESMEDDPVFNAGKGSVLTLDGEIEMEALISEGKHLKSGAVTLVKNIAHPISLARRVMEDTPHAFLGGAAVNQFATKIGVPLVSDDYLVTPAAVAALESFKKSKAAPTTIEIGEGGVGTVGCVAIDMSGHVASATSTGGITGKYNGRIGDTPLLGCGGYADDERGAVSTTGHGETIMRYNLAQRILCDIANGKSAQDATRDQCEGMTRRLNNTAGAITISRTGEVGVFFTTRRMAWAYQQGEELHYGIEPGQHLVEKA